MKRILSIFVIMLFLIVSFPFDGMVNPVIYSASNNKKATMIFPTFHKAGYDRYGKMLEGNRNFPWEERGQTNWGRFLRGDTSNTYLMPYSPNALDTLSSPIKVSLPGKASTWPFLWAEFYLDINASGGTSQESNKWYAVLDDGGQLWLDPDGQFNDPRYDKTADPISQNYISGKCSDNIRLS